MGQVIRHGLRNVMKRNEKRFLVRHSLNKFKQRERQRWKQREGDRETGRDVEFTFFSLNSTS